MATGDQPLSDGQWLRQALDPAHLAALDQIGSTGRPGTRLQGLPEGVAEALAAVTARIRADALPHARPVRAVWFTKDNEANWGVPWHQDRVIAVQDHHDLPGFAQWSRKAGVWHCEPPVSILQGMLFVRVHLDDCDDENGAMRIARGSHAEGAVRSDDAARLAARWPEEICAARRGDIQVLPMLTLHRSLPARTPRPRRALRLDYAATALPSPLCWAGVQE